MEILSIYRGARISAFKAREVTREIQGLPVAAALDIVAFSPKKAAGIVAKTLKSAIANAENNANLKVDTLTVLEATVGEAPTMSRSKSRARGSSSKIRKRSSHIRIILTDEIYIEPPRRSQGKKKPSRKQPKPEAHKPAAKLSARVTPESIVESSPEPVESPAEPVETEAVSAS